MPGPCARRCCRTEARNATVGSDDQANSSTAVEANPPLKAVLDVRTARVIGGAANIQGREPLPWHLARATADGLRPRVDARFLSQAKYRTAGGVRGRSAGGLLVVIRHGIIQSNP